MADQRQKNPIREFFNFNDVITYFFRKNKNQKKPDFNLRMMHIINKISIIIFILALIVLILRNLVLH